MDELKIRTFPGEMDVNRKRIAEESRKRRFFNAKQRQIGLDVEALNYQVHERLLSRAKEEERDRKFAEEAKRQSELAELMERQKNDEIREKNKKVDEFRKTEQRTEARKEFDLYDPDRKRKEQPARTSDDQSCPVSGLLKFEGEDNEKKDRSMRQKSQVQDILLQQMQEKRMKSFKESKERLDWESVMLQQDNYAQHLEQLARRRSKEAVSAVIAENRNLARQKQEALMRQKIEDDFEKQKDVEFNVRGYLLTENPCVGRSSFGPNRVASDRWKGMTKEQLKELYDGQLKQMAEKQKKKDQELYEKSLWDKQIRSLDDSCQRLEEEQKDSKRKLNEQVISMNQYLAQEQRRQQEFLNKVVYTNAPSKEFFEQFNTTSR